MRLDVFILWGLAILSGTAYFWGKAGQDGLPGVAPPWLYRSAEAVGPVVCVLAVALALALHYARWSARRAAARALPPDQGNE